MIQVKGSPDPNHFIFEINVGKRRIRHTETLKSNIFRSTQNRLKIPIQSLYMSNPTLSDIDFKNKIAWVPLIQPFTNHLNRR